MPSRGETIGLTKKSDMVIAHSMLMVDFLGDLMSKELINSFEVAVKPFLEFKQKFGKNDVNMRFRGSNVPKAFAEKDSGIGSYVHENEFGKVIGMILNDFPEFGKLLGLTTNMFKRNADLNIEVVNQNMMDDILALAKTLPDFAVIEIRPSFYQLTSNKFPLININIKNISVNKTDQLSLYSQNRTEEIIPPLNYVGTIDDRRFSISRRLDAANAEISLNNRDEVLVNLSQTNKNILFRNEPDIFYAEPYKDFGQITHDVARWVRFLSTTYGTETLKTALNDENIKAISDSLHWCIDKDFNKGIDNAFYRNSYLGNMIFLLLSNPVAFILVQEKMPFLFAANKFYQPTIMPDKIKQALIISVNNQSLDDILKIFTQINHPVCEGKTSAQLVTDILTLISNPEMILKAISESGTYLLKSLKSFVQLFTIFDTQDQLTKKPYPLDPYKLEFKQTIPVM